MEAISTLTEVFLPVQISMAERRVEFSKLARGKLIGIRVEAPSLQRVYLDIALAFFESITTGSRVAPAETLRERLELSGATPAELLEKWVEALRQVYNDKKMVALRAVFEKFDGKTLVAVFHGTPYSALNHGPFHSIAPVEKGNVKLAMDGPADKPFCAEWLWSE